MKKAFVTYLSLILVLLLVLGVTVSAFASGNGPSQPELTAEPPAESPAVFPGDEVIPEDLFEPDPDGCSFVPDEPDPDWDDFDPEAYWDNSFWDNYDPKIWEETVPCSDSEPQMPEYEDQWTVMVYLCGGCFESGEGEHLATDSLRSIASALPSDDVNVIIQTGGTSCWYCDDLGVSPSTDTLQKYFFDKDGFSLVDEQPLASMADARTLSSFIRWCHSNYPAEKYLLCFWGAGDGQHGLYCDELYDSYMPLDNFADAIYASGTMLDAVLMDCGYMANLELGSQLCDCVHYLYASENAIPGDGIPYTEFLQRIYDDPSCDGAQLGRYLCNTIHQVYANKNTHESNYLTFSAVDLTKIVDVDFALDQLMADIGPRLNSDLDTSILLRAISEAEHYSDMVDLYDLAAAVKGAGIPAKTCIDLQNAVSDAVVYSVSGDGDSGSHGLSIFYAPSCCTGGMNTYLRSCANSQWLAFLDAVNATWSAPEYLYLYTDRLPSVGPELFVKADLIHGKEQSSLTITNGDLAVTNISYMLMKYDSASDTWYRLGTCGDVTTEQTEDGLTTYRPSFKNVWPAINDVYLDMEMAYESEEYSIFNVPVYFPDEDEEMTLRIGFTRSDPENGSYSFTDGSFDIYGFWNGKEANVDIPNRDSYYDNSFYSSKMQIVRPRYTIARTHIDDKLADRIITATPAMEVTLKSLPMGDYAYYYRIIDIFGNELYTGPAFFSLDSNGKVVNVSLMREIKFNSSLCSSAELIEMYGQDVMNQYTNYCRANKY